jgi:energy-coupling factor transporter ATP-binding protein EcfA2
VILDGVNLDCSRGKITTIVGPSGCGKTVLLKHLSLLLRPDSGQIIIDGIDVTRLNSRAVDMSKRSERRNAPSVRADRRGGAPGSSAPGSQLPRAGSVVGVPPLRYRIEDVPALVEHFLTFFNERLQPRVTVLSMAQGALEAMQRYP